jgi:type I restriction enzyme S subunit
MAQLLYTEWFVKFKFPGHEKIKLVDSGTSYGKIPEGWEVKSPADLNIFTACKNRIKKFVGDKLYFDTSCIDGINFIKEPLTVDWETIPSRAQFAPIYNSVWFARMSKTYKVLFFNKSSKNEVNNYLLSSGMLGLETDEKYLGFLFSLIKSESFHKQKDSRATGATQVSLTDEGFEGMRIVFPTYDLIEKYSNTVNDYVGQILALHRCNKNLSKLRDLLIPQLVTGKRELKNI